MILKLNPKHYYTNMSQSLKPMVKWSGGKGDEIPKFIQHIPEEYDTYLEPFIGGGSPFIFILTPQKQLFQMFIQNL